tara:strand:- start:215 stop:481 length:267 start_codon:yes stop_codon:yes gene_type:complete
MNGDFKFPEDGKLSGLSGLSKSQCFMDGVEFGVFMHSHTVANMTGSTERVRMRSCHRERANLFLTVNGYEPDIKWINDDFISVRIGNA